MGTKLRDNAVHPGHIWRAFSQTDRMGKNKGIPFDWKDMKPTERSCLFFQTRDTGFVEFVSEQELKSRF
jgi:hypothetical protein